MGELIIDKISSLKIINKDTGKVICELPTEIQSIEGVEEDGQKEMPTVQRMDYGRHF